MKVLCFIKEVIFYYLGYNGKPVNIFKQMSVFFRAVAGCIAGSSS